MAAERSRQAPLPRGRHTLSPEDVLASQRERLVRAMLDSVGSNGYAATTVPSVVAAARVSRNAFYALFDDKADCFIAACDDLASEMLGALIASAGDTGWLDALRDGMVVYLQWWQQRPGFTRAYFVELPAAGERAVAQRERQYEAFRAMFEGLAAMARAEDPGLRPLPPLATRLLVAGITELLGEESRAGRIDRLDELNDDLLAFTIAMLADEATAERAFA